MSENPVNNKQQVNAKLSFSRLKSAANWMNKTNNNNTPTRTGKIQVKNKWKKKKIVINSNNNCKLKECNTNLNDTSHENWKRLRTKIKHSAEIRLQCKRMFWMLLRKVNKKNIHVVRPIRRVNKSGQLHSDQTTECM